MQVTTKEAISILRIALVAEGQTTVEEERTRAAQHDLELALQDKRARAELNRRGERKRLEAERDEILARFHAGASVLRPGASMELSVQNKPADDAVRLRHINTRLEALRDAS